MNISPVGGGTAEEPYRAGWQFYAVIAAASAIRYWLGSGYPVFAIGSAVHDDYLFIKLASYLLHGQWLGSYDQYTLIKGPFYPLFIAAAHLTGLPLLDMEQALYIFSAFVLILAIAPILKNRVLLFLLFAAILFLPISFDFWIAARIIRDFVYASLTLLLVACTIALTTRTSASLLQLLPWSLGLGLSLFAFWTIREEAAWILPFVVLFLGGGLAYLVLIAHPQILWRLGLILLTLAIWWGGVAAVSWINYSHYGIFAVTEINDPTFDAAFGALTRVKSPVWYPDVPVTAEARKLIYPLSPAVRELEPFLEGQLGKNWASFDTRRYPNPHEVEIQGGWNMWAFRDAVASAGHYSSGKFPAAYYRQIAAQIGQACDSGALKCYPKTISISQPMDARHLPFIAQSTLRSAKFLFRFKNFTVTDHYASLAPDHWPIFEEVTNQLVSGGGKSASGQNSTSANAVHHFFVVKVISRIAHGYALVAPSFSIFAVLVFILELLHNLIRRRITLAVLLSLGLWIEIAARVFLLALLDATSFPAINTSYFAPAYPLVVTVQFLSASIVYQWIVQFSRRRVTAGSAT